MPLHHISDERIEDDSHDPSPRRGGALQPFRHPIFRRVWIANLASNFGVLIQSVGASWMMASITSSADMVALVQASTSLPIMMFSLVAGAISDNFDRRKVMLAAQGFMLAVAVALTICAFLGLVTPWLLLGFTFLIGCGTALNGPAWQSSVGEMVPRKDLAAAIALNGMGFNIARSLGPALGGLIVATAGAASAFAINSVSYIALMAVLARWRPVLPERLLPRETLGVALGAGLRYVAMSPSIVIVIVRSCAFGFAGSAVQALMPLIARDLVSGGPLTFGLLLGAFGVGAVGGALLSANLRQSMSVETMIRCSFLAIAACAAVCGLSRSTPITMVGLALGGASWVIAFSTFNVSVQMSSPRWVVGRSLALYQTAVFGGLAFGSWAWGFYAEHGGGPARALLLSAVAGVVGAALGLRYRLRPLAELNLDPLSRWTEPTLAVDIKPRSGPIVVQIEYVIRPEDRIVFLNLMSERRRIRLRDGARHWVLMRDLSDPELWIERYHSPTWVEYVRQAQRITQADAEVGERIRALHHGPTPPRVHRMIERQTGSLHTVSRNQTMPSGISGSSQS